LGGGRGGRGDLFALGNLSVNICNIGDTYCWSDDEACSLGVELLAEGPRLHQLVQKVAVCFFASCAGSAKGELWAELVASD